MVRLTVQIMLAGLVICSALIGVLVSLGHRLKTLELAYVSSIGASSIITTVDILTGIQLPLIGTESSTFFSWSPDGQQIAFMIGRGMSNPLYLMSADGHNKRLVTWIGYTNKSVWAPDSQQLVFSQLNPYRDQLYIVSVDAGEPRRLTDDSTSDGIPLWSPDGQYIAYLASVSNQAVLTITSVDGQTRQVFNDVGNANFVWAPHGHQIVFVKTDGGTWIADVAAGTQKHLFDLPSPQNAPSWSPNGQTLTFVSVDDRRQRSISTINADGSSPRHLIENLFVNLLQPVSWSADGQRFSFVAYPRPDQSAEIYVGTVGDGQVQRLTYSSAEDLFPSWRP